MWSEDIVTSKHLPPKHSLPQQAIRKCALLKTRKQNNKDKNLRSENRATLEQRDFSGQWQRKVSRQLLYSSFKGQTVWAGAERWKSRKK